MLDLVLAGIVDIFLDPRAILLGFVATLIGIVLGALPGISATMSLAVLLPFSFVMTPANAMVFLIAIFYGSVYGGSISAILLNIPGTPGSMVTQLDGYPMARKGQAGQALTYALFASTFGGVIGLLSLVVLSPILASVALLFQSPEFATLMIFGLSVLAFASPGSTYLGVLSGIFGLLLGTIGLDVVTGVSRLDFGIPNLEAGLNLIPVAVGIFGLAEVLENLERDTLHHAGKGIRELGRLMPGWRALLSTSFTALRSSFWGIFIGLIPAAGSAIAVSIAYGQEKRLFQGRENFGDGNPRGVVAAEAGNNAAVGGDLIPMMSLGIPGDSVTAVLLGALLIHGLRPGPELFENNADFVGAVYSALALTIVATVFWAIGAIRLFVHVLSAPPRVLAIGIILLCVVGSYAAQNSYFDILVMILSGVIGYLMSKADVPRAPIVFGLVLGPLLEDNLRRSLMLYDSWLVFVERPVSLIFLLLSIVSIVVPMLTSQRYKPPSGADV